jgi:monoamine oxidase
MHQMPGPAEDMDADIIVIGAGVSGLAAGGELARRGWRVRILEARDRIGGRILTSAPRNWPGPVELGPEFIHGGTRTLQAVLRRAGLRTRPVETNMWWRENGRLELVPDFWECIKRVASRIPWRNRGHSFQHFLRTKGRKFELRDRRLAEAYVAGFNAASPARLSAHAQRTDHAGADTNDLKIDGRYDAVARALQKAWPRARVDLHLNSIVTQVGWRVGAVAVQARPPGKKTVTHRARAAVITLPLGVLQARSVKFAPALREKERIIARMGWGQVVRVVLRFRPGFWSAPFLPDTLAAGSGRAFGFVTAPQESVPVWWALAAPAPVLTGWAGGRPAAALSRCRPAEIRDAALRSLASILNTSQAELRRRLADWRTHDWESDPFSRGAYSHIVAGVENGPERLAEPVAGTLFFAGEATAKDVGTVHGALESGLQAAHTVDTMLLNQQLATQEIFPWPDS